MLILLVFGACATVHFTELAGPPSSRAGVYIYRPEVTALAARSFTVQLAHYDEGYRPERQPRNLREVELANYEYVYYQLPPGDYRLRSADFDDAEIITTFEAGTTYYFRLQLFATSFFGRTDALLEGVGRVQALRDFLQHEPAIERHATSEDPAPAPE